MATYLIASIKVKNAEAFEEYKRQVPHTIAKYGGRYLVRGGEGEVVEGNWQTNRLVVLEFPDKNLFNNWYNSEDYKNLKILRKTHAATDLVIVEGI
ncbi:DUF1330 domain-containing protein [Nostoc cf. edaphicum LEGE 07299]|uniref:DUF1330 domain-containing protein n=1 Tax=Nostoc cf. edaphicum LEGE 07299 TaxID=2777974 RepID=A0ABR9U1J9_9NOSO|nr:DUF1330 domain-containing protein [Nostoc edaphicum]MBE9105750.1 DUF1330 domain-containing protein [Nostoc cf. edaphicum LEGE 07299]